MNVSEFDYELPRELIAQSPAQHREDARLLVPLEDGGVEHSSIRDLPNWLRAGDLLVLNDTRVRRARLHARRETGGAVELLLLHPEEEGAWLAMARPAARLKPGEVISADGLTVRMLRRVETGEWLVEFPNLTGDELEARLEESGELPLPPYIQRGVGEQTAEDFERYQTVYARELGAVAAPTAGLHFTDSLLQRLEEAGVHKAFVTLHVGAGTFQPVTADRTEDHVMHSEWYSIPEATVAAVERCRSESGRVIAVGTTSLRALESSAAEYGSLRPGTGDTNLFLTPGSELRVADRLLTNFHLPKSTLLMLVAAFSGLERTRELYRIAIENEYRFYSYGDAMLLSRA